MDDLRKSHSINQLHGVVLKAVIFANTVYRNDVAMVKASGRFRFPLESLQLFF